MVTFLYLLGSSALAAGTGGPAPDTTTLNLTIGLSGSLEIDCTIQGAGRTTGAFVDPATLTENETANGTFGDVGNVDNLFAFNSGAGEWLVAADLELQCAPTAGLTAISVTVDQGTNTGGLETFFHGGHDDLNGASPSNPLGGGGFEFVSAAAVGTGPFAGPIPFMVGAIADPGEITGNAEAVFSFLPQ